MARLYAEDDKNFLFFTEGYMPDRDNIIRCRPRNPSILREPGKTFPDNESALAWTLSAFAFRLLYNRRLKVLDAIGGTSIHLDTFVIGPSGNRGGELNGWFNEKSGDSYYRLFIHRVPFEGFQSEYGARGIWPSIYSRIIKQKEKPLEIRHKTIAYAELKLLQPHTKGYLKQLLDAYREDNTSIENVLNQSGHSYWASRLTYHDRIS